MENKARMTERKGLSKKVRFEVFKRDSFICQYCGRKAPDVILHVDHINPVANGGNNDIMNLITSCFECNSGKSDRLLDDKSIIEKQRRQLEALQERREQIELMIDWKRSLSELDSDVEMMILTYIDSKIHPYHINDNGKKSIKQLLSKFELSLILDSIDESSKKYLKYDLNNDLIQESVENFFDKIGGMTAIKTMPPIKQKLAYIKGIARNRFSYWDDRKGSIILNSYVESLEEHWSEEAILLDLENEVIKITKEADNWSAWKNTLEKWTQDIKGWEKKDKTVQVAVHPKEFSLEELEKRAYSADFRQNSNIAALIYIGKAFPDFDSSFFLESLLQQLKDFLDENENYFKEDFEVGFWDFIEKYALEIFFDYDFFATEGGEYHLLKLREIVFDLIYNIFNVYHYSPKEYSPKDVDILVMFHKKNISKKVDILNCYL